MEKADIAECVHRNQRGSSPPPVTPISLAFATSGLIPRIGVPVLSRLVTHTALVAEGGLALRRRRSYLTT
ncbi:hypothetical protein CcrColossus_gp163 [Caulobacter phage CcrColossus]|uniref:Uncharacterized protein n=1 Tax=Caulobacter phage CcrColossus TaxID=1211640 RepID=K4JVY5_9CAUD|nr:hypothetical protein CcrColossus_gp163 [Caulobacter phage CcrColossus]AFU88033.1 hypothetical protein CcrColossus_gp163 [Caulobacter phage CcrColossus]